MMKRIKTTILSSILALSAPAIFTSCIEEVNPTDKLTGEEISNLDGAQLSYMNGIVSEMIDYDTYLSKSSSDDDYRNDFGYPCQIAFREVLGSDFPVKDSNYSYWYNAEDCSQISYKSIYTYFYYYKIISATNKLVGIVDPETANQSALNYLGCAKAFRALAYFDLARMFEYQKTGIATCDDEATALKCWGLTVPIVTEKTTDQELKNNPRADFATMYRFIITDLNDAEEYLKSYNRESKTMPNLKVVQGLKARFWLELATRFENSPEDLQKMIDKDNEEMTYDKVGISSARECYEKAKSYADNAANGFSEMTKSEWQDPLTGFNKECSSWMWKMSYSSKEQLPYSYFSYPGMVCSEASWSNCAWGAYRCIGSWLYSKIDAGDWRKDSWIEPTTAGTTSGYKKYTEFCGGAPLIKKSAWNELPKYSNLKFRPASGDVSSFYIGGLVELPLMRMEEMKFISIECTAHLTSVDEACSKLKDFIQSARYNSSATYTPTDYEGVEVGGVMKRFNEALMLQKRIEFWGEGITYFDYKRLKMPVQRTRNDNYEGAFMLNSNPAEGCVAPWMDLFVPSSEQSTDAAIVLNPSVDKSITTTSNYPLQ